MGGVSTERKEVRHEQCTVVLGFIHSCTRGRFGTFERKLELIN
jgi:hypothetical protein